MISYRLAVALAMLALIACDGSDKPISYIDGMVRTDTPVFVTAADPVDELNARVTLGGQQTTYYARDYPNGEWVIDAALAENREHYIAVSWYSAEHLLMEQSGSFYIDGDNPEILLDLDFVTAGPDRFDDDCDQISNLDELKAGTNPGPVQGSCNEPIAIPDPAETEGVWISHEYKSFGNYTDKVNGIAQEIQLRKTDPQLATYYGVKVGSEGDIIQADGSVTTAEVNMHLVNKPTDTNLARFFVNYAESVIAADGANCRDNGSGFLCIIPFNSIPNRWYELQLNEIAGGLWQGSVVDVKTGASTLIATMEMPSQTKWKRHAIAMGYSDRITAAQCSQTLSKSTLRYTEAVINNTFTIPFKRVIVSDCLTIGNSWTGHAYSYGTRTKDGETSLRTLSIGR